MNRVADDMDAEARLAAFQQSLEQLGWSVDRNLRLDTRYGRERCRSRSARTLRSWSRSRRTSCWRSGTVSVAALQHATRTVPIVFAAVSDPVGAGLVNTLARPGGNVTGFMNFEYQPEWEMAGAPEADRAAG